MTSSGKEEPDPERTSPDPASPSPATADLARTSKPAADPAGWSSPGI
jgi:hypothetical protein